MMLVLLNFPVYYSDIVCTDSGRIYAGVVILRARICFGFLFSLGSGFRYNGWHSEVCLQKSQLQFSPSIEASSGLKGCFLVVFAKVAVEKRICSMAKIFVQQCCWLFWFWFNMNILKQKFTRVTVPPSSHS